MLQDVDAGKDVELDALVVVVREIAEAVGVPTPTSIRSWAWRACMPESAGCTQRMGPSSSDLRP
jgi:hypothetical protein